MKIHHERKREIQDTDSYDNAVAVTGNPMIRNEHQVSQKAVVRSNSEAAKMGADVRAELETADEGDKH